MYYAFFKIPRQALLDGTDVIFTPLHLLSQNWNR